MAKRTEKKELRLISFDEPLPKGAKKLADLPQHRKKLIEIVTIILEPEPEPDHPAEVTEILKPPPKPKPPPRIITRTMPQMGRYAALSTNGRPATVVRPAHMRVAARRMMARTAPSHPNTAARAAVGQPTMSRAIMRNVTDLKQAAQLAENANRERMLTRAPQAAIIFERSGPRPASPVAIKVVQRLATQPAFHSFARTMLMSPDAISTGPAPRGEPKTRPDPRNSAPANRTSARARLGGLKSSPPISGPSRPGMSGRAAGKSSGPSASSAGGSPAGGPR